MKQKKRILTTMILSVMVLSIFTLPVLAANTTYKGTAKVWAGIPLGGHTYVATPWTVVASQSPKNIQSITTGTSYTTGGITIFTYSHYNTWAVKTGSTTFEVRASGLCTTGIGYFTISMGLQTFLADQSIN